MSLSYTLGTRQQRLYTEVADLYRPIDSTGSEQVYDLVFSNIPCQLVPTDNFDTQQGATRLKSNHLMTSDSIHFHVDQEIGPEWVVHIKSGSVRYPDSTFTTLGEGEAHAYRAKYKRVYVNQIIPLLPSQIS